MEWSLADIRCFVRARSSFAVRGVIGTAALSAFAADHFGRSEILVRHVCWNDVDRDAVFGMRVIAGVPSRRDVDFEDCHIFVREYRKMIRCLYNRYAHLLVLRYCWSGEDTDEQQNRCCDNRWS